MEDFDRLADLNRRALDAVADEFPEEAELGDALLIFDVILPDDAGTEIRTVGTSSRVSVAVGLCEFARTQMVTEFVRSDGDDDDD